MEITRLQPDGLVVSPAFSHVAVPVRLFSAPSDADHQRRVRGHRTAAGTGRERRRW